MFILWRKCVHTPGQVEPSCFLKGLGLNWHIVRYSNSRCETWGVCPICRTESLSQPYILYTIMRYMKYKILQQMPRHREVQLLVFLVGGTFGFRRARFPCCLGLLLCQRLGFELLVPPLEIVCAQRLYVRSAIAFTRLSRIT